MATAIVGTTDGLREIGGGEQVWHLGREVTALARDNGTWWAILDGHNVWKAGSDMSWEEVASSDELRLNCILPTEDGPLVGTAESHVYRVAKNELQRVESFEATPGRDTWHTPWGGPPDVRSMVSSPSGDVFANVHVGGIPRSQDSGDTWSPTIEVNADVHQVGFDSTSGLLLAACARGLAVSADGGASWRYDSEGAHGRYMRGVAVVGETVLATASTGPYTDRAAVYRRPATSDGPFEKCVSGLPDWFSDNVDTYCVDGDQTTAFFGTADGDVYVSEDEGMTWEVAASCLPAVRCVAVAGD